MCLDLTGLSWLPRRILAFLARKLLDAGDVKSIDEQVGLDVIVERTVSAEAWREVDLQDVGLEGVVEDDVEAQQLEAAVAVVWVLDFLDSREQMVLHRNDGLDDCVVDALPDRLHVNAHSLQVLLKLRQTPLVAVISLV